MQLLHLLFGTFFYICFEMDDYTKIKRLYEVILTG